jgi:peptide/nickel transport system permease protein
VRSAAHADFGYSIAYNAPVAPLLWERAKNTLLLTSTGMLLTWLISVPLGVWTAARRGRMLDQGVRVASSLLVSIPEVVIAVALLAIVVRWRVLPVGGMRSVDNEGLSQWARLQDIASRMLLPTIILTLAESAIIVRHVRASVLEVLGAPFVQAARGLGIGRTRLLFRHVLPVAASPAISLFGFSLAGLLSGSLLVEVMCGWPGLGPLILEATLSRDFYLVIGGIMLSALFMAGGNLIADIMLLACDPRIQTGAADAG